MNNLRRRLERLEERVAPNPGPRRIIVTNVPCDDSGCTVEIFRGLYADILGSPLTPQELNDLKEKYRREREKTDE